MKRVYIINSKRTAIGKFLGSFYECDESDVCVQVIKKLTENINTSDIDEVIIGNAISAGMGQGIARKISVNSGIPFKTPAYTVSMVCGSGMQAVINGWKSIKCGNNLELVGGMEFMSNIPFATNSYIRLGKKFGDFNMIDLMTHDGLIDSFSGVHMGITAENIAKELQITRVEQDEYSFLAQQRAISAVDSGKFVDEIVPINLRDWKNKEYIFDKDEFPNRDSNISKLSLLKPTFLHDGRGTVTAGSSSGINDGASFLLLASDLYCNEKNIIPEIEISGVCSVGCDPQLMGLGPYYAIKKICEENNVCFNDVEALEINEAFASQFLGCCKLISKEYNITKEQLINITNVNGSGLGLGHPLGATGARIITSLAHRMTSDNLKLGIASLCVGGGQGLAVLLRKVN